MKKQNILLFGIAAALTFNSCGDKPNESGNEGGHEQEVGAENDGSETSEVTADLSILDPRTYDFSKVVTSVDLNKSLLLLKGKEIKMVIYPAMLYDGVTLGTGGYAGCQAGTCSNSSDCNLNVEFKESHDLVLKKDMPLYIKGRVDLSGFGNSLDISEAELLSENEIPTAQDFNPQTFSMETVYNPQGLLDFLLAWGGKEVTVSGDFLGTTISKSADGTELLEAKIEIGSWEQKVRCTFPTEAEAKAFNAGEGMVTIKGKLSPDSDYYEVPIVENSVRVQ